MKDRLVEVFWAAVKAAAVTFVILLLLQILPISVSVEAGGPRRSLGVDVNGSLDVSQQRGYWTVRNQ